MSTLFKLSLRGLQRSPGFTLVALSILALGIGATTAMFSIARTVLLKPLPYRDPEQLVTILFHIPSFSKQLTTVPVNAQHYQLWRDRSRTLQGVTMLDPASAILSGLGEAETVTGGRVSANFFQLLGVQPRFGRGFTTGEDQPGHNRVVIVSDHFWSHELGSRPDVLGRKILLDGEPYQIVGVMPHGFLFPRGSQLSDIVQLPERADYWVPLVFSSSDLASPVMNMDFVAVARLKPGITLAQAQADLSALEKGIEKRFPERIELDPVIHPLQQLIARQVRLPLIILMASVVAVLLIVCINVMNLLLVRANSRRKEWAIQLAIGARGRNLLAAAFLEGLLLTVPAALLGCLLAAWLLALVRLHAPFDLPRVNELSVDGIALLFASMLSILSAILFAVLPAWRSARLDPQNALKSAGRSSSEGRESHSAGRILVAAEVALSTVLLLTAGLLLRSFITLLDVSPGVRVDNLLTARINLPPNTYHADTAIHSFYRGLVDKVRALPGVEAAGTVSTLPITPEDNNNPATAGDRAAPPVTQWPIIHTHSASSGYFQAAGIPLKEGRPFEERDGSALETVISANLAGRLWPGQSALGRPLRLYSAKRMATIVGVVGAVRASSLEDEPGMSVYFPDWLQVDGDMSLVVRTAVQPDSLSPAIRRAVHQLDPQAAVPSIETMRQIVSDSLAPKRFELSLLVAFALIALVLASLGIYGVLTFVTARRTSEIGIRMALGARPDQILSATLLKGMAAPVAGIFLGLGISTALSHVLASLLFEVQPLDPTIYVATALILLLVAALACWAPAHRAARLSPVDALRHE